MEQAQRGIKASRDALQHAHDAIELAKEGNKAVSEAFEGVRLSLRNS